MGNKQSRTEGMSFNRDDWDKEGQTPYFDILISNKTGIKAFLYHFTLKDNESSDEELSLYKNRLNGQSNLVKVIAVNIIESGFEICGKKANMEVVTESYYSLLCDMRPLTSNESMIVLYNALKGFQRIFELYGDVQITDRMICINGNGETKVWLNQNYGMNHTANDSFIKESEEQMKSQVKAKNYPQRISHRNQSMKNMVRKIVQHVEKKHPSSKFDEPFRTNIYNQFSFQAAIEIVNNQEKISSNVLKENKIKITSSKQSYKASLFVIPQQIKVVDTSSLNQSSLKKVVDASSIKQKVELLPTNSTQLNSKLIFKYENPTQNFNPRLTWQNSNKPLQK